MLAEEMMRDRMAAPADEGLKRVSAAAEKLLLLQAEADKLEEALASKKEELRMVAEGTLPEAMAEVGIAEFKLNDGSKITVKPFYSASIGDSNREDCHSWLRENGFGDLIKHELTVQLGRDRDAVAAELKVVLKEKDLPYVDKEGVNSSTLNAFVKEQVEKGKALPLDKFKVFIGRKAKVSAPKKGERL